jgi:Nuclease-related domain
MGEWRVKHDGVCARCGAQLRHGEPAVWDRGSRTIRCVECPTAAAADAESAIDAGVAGRSARAEYERRAGKRDAAITEEWGTGFVAKVVRAISTEPQSTRAWASGAAGEEKLAAALAKVPRLRMLHDRRVHGTKANIDHIVIAPAGVFVIDAKNHHGVVEIRNRGWLLRPDYRLTVGRRDCSAMADKMSWQVEAVVDALRVAGVEPLPPVTPVLCFLEAEWPLFGAPEEFHGVRLESHRSVKRLLVREAVLDDDSADAITRSLATALPQK